MFMHVTMANTSANTPFVRKKTPIENGRFIVCFPASVVLLHRNYLNSLCVDFSQILVVASPGPYTERVSTETFL